jgi:hypothetical protein
MELAREKGKFNDGRKLYAMKCKFESHTIARYTNPFVKLIDVFKSLGSTSES